MPREDDEAQLVAEVRAALPGLLGDPAGAYVWIACDTATTRALARFTRKGLAVPGPQMHALGGWRP
ncbi:SIP domain-containing protein [Streptomyces sp. BE20]|uniref:SIP domain-containing protein n=1 Tax=Streptomyces sp. BE20 TaxID=3002525 RepID=UPI003FA6D5E9